MSGSETAALIVAITGAVSAIFLGIRNLRSDKFKHEVEQGAALLTGYTNMVADLRAQHVEDRAAWQRREQEIRQQHAVELHERDERIDELGAQLYALQHRDQEMRERGTDE